LSRRIFIAGTAYSILRLVTTDWLIGVDAVLLVGVAGMHTISDLRKLLGLSTANQVRNRIEAIKDVLSLHLRRGPNNQILVSDGGLELLRQLQELYDSGLTLTEASEIIQSSAYNKEHASSSVSSGFTQKKTNVEERDELIAALKEEIAFLRQRVAFLESQQQTKKDVAAPRSWWESLREEADGA